LCGEASQCARSTFTSAGARITSRCAAGVFQLLRGAAAGELLADAEQAHVEVNVAPAETECLADAEPRIREELEEDAVQAAVVDEPAEVALAEDADLRALAGEGLLARLQAVDGVDADPALPHGVAENLAQGDEGEQRGRPCERALVSLRPGGDPVRRQIAELHRAER